MARDTRTGQVLERIVLPSLENGGYKYQRQVNIGQRFGRGKHIADIIATSKEDENYIISLKWQQVPGTAEQKVPFEVICLAEAIINGKNAFAKAYLVLGGEGWKLREFFIQGGLSKHLVYGNLVEIVSLENFIAKANKTAL
ncbi:PD-(D/E)XK nuclease superfamily protein [Candidatus Riflebacteria bacterium]